MNNLNNIPGEIIKTSALPENVPTHLIGVIMGTSPQTVKYSTQALAYSVSQLMTNVVKTDEFYADPSWITALSWDKLTNVPSFSTSLASLSDVQLGTLSAGEALVYNGTKWVNQSVGELDTLNSVTTRGNTTTNAITTGGLYSPYLRLDTAATTTLVPGMFRWNDADGTVDLRLKGDNVTLQLGQETVVRVVNKTGANLLESQYKVVRVRIASEGGAQGQRLAVVLAQGNNDPDSVTTLGIVTEDIGNNQEGFITVFGNVSGINTTGSLQGETWVDGDVLYLSPTTPGAITKVKPVAPQHTVVLGYVVYAHANNGKIFVKVDNGYELEELHDVLPTPYVNKGVLYRDTATNLWKSATVETLLGGTPLLTTPTLAQVTSAGNTTTNAITVGGLTVATNLIYTDLVNGRVGVGTVSPSSKLHVETGISDTELFRVINPGAGGSVNRGAGIIVSMLNTQVTGGRTRIRQYDTAGYAVRNFIEFVSGNTGFTAEGSTTISGWYEVGLVTNNALRLLVASTGNVLINTTTDAGYKLDVNGTARIQSDVLIKGSTSGTGASALTVQNSSATTIFRIQNDGQISIGGVVVQASGAAFFYNNIYANYFLARNVGLTFDTNYIRYTNFTGTVTASSALARGVYLNNTLVAAANNDVLVGLDITPTFTLGAYTGVSSVALRTTSGEIRFGSLTAATTTKVVYYNSATGQLSQGDAPVTSYARRSDFVTDTNYLGVAVSGSSESASVWKIYKIVVSSSGATTKTSATNVAWTDRYTVIYS